MGERSTTHISGTPSTFPERHFVPGAVGGASPVTSLTGMAGQAVGERPPGGSLAAVLAQPPTPVTSGKLSTVLATDTPLYCSRQVARVLFVC